MYTTYISLRTTNPFIYLQLTNVNLQAIIKLDDMRKVVLRISEPFVLVEQMVLFLYLLNFHNKYDRYK